MGLLHQPLDETYGSLSHDAVYLLRCSIDIPSGLLLHPLHVLLQILPHLSWIRHLDCSSPNAAALDDGFVDGTLSVAVFPTRSSLMSIARGASR